MECTLIENNFEYKWTRTAQTCVVQGSTIAICAGEDREWEELRRTKAINYQSFNIIQLLNLIHHIAKINKNKNDVNGGNEMASCQSKG